MNNFRAILKQFFNQIWLIKVASCCLFIAVNIITVNLSAQVISNQGAVINMHSGVVVTSGDAYNTGGNILNNGNFNLSGSYISTGSTSGNGFYRLGGNWVNTGGFFTPGMSTVIFNGASNQEIRRTGGETFNNLAIINTGLTPSNWITIFNNVNISNKLSMASGNINTGAFILNLTNQSAASLEYTSSSGSRISGRFERGMGEQANYLFPLGNGYYNPLNLKTNAVPSAGSVLSQFLSAPPSGTGFPIIDPPVEISRFYKDGYWNLTAKNGFAITDFNINLNATGFIDSIHIDTRLIKRVPAGNWEVDGSHQDADTVNHVIFRSNLSDGISTSGTLFALGRPRPLIIKHPRDTVVCEETYPSFTVVATGTQALRYTWYKVAIPDFEILNSNPHFSGARTPTLTILGATLADTGLYYCVVRDRFSNSSRTDTAHLAVQKIPRAILTNSNQPQKCSNVTFDPIIMGLAYWDNPGTTFYWYRTEPDSIITADVPVSGTASNIGDVISGTFNNLTDRPLTITFYIIPIGPLPRFCHGNPVPAYVTVNPTPRVTPVNVKPSICYGDGTQINLTTRTQMTSGNMRFDYTVTKTGGALLTGIINDTTNLKPGHLIHYHYRNNSDTIQSVHYFVTPRVDNAICPAGVMVESEVKVHALPLQRIEVDKPLTCSGGAGLAALSAILSKGADPYLVNWDGSVGYHSTSAVIEDLSMGKYVAKITDNLGCFKKDSISIVPVFARPYIVASILPPLNLYNVSCIGANDGTYVIYVRGGITPPYQYWVSKDGIEIYSGVLTNNLNLLDPLTFKYYNLQGAGVYSIRIRDVNGCEDTRETTLRPPTPVTATFEKLTFQGGFNVSCKGYSNGSVKAFVTGGNGGYTYHWYKIDGTITGPVNTDRLDNINAGTYRLEVTDILGCITNLYVDITEPQGMQLAGSQLSDSPDHSFNVSCNGGNNGSISITLSGGSGNYLHKWTGPNGFTSTIKDVSGLRAGMYIDSIKDLNGCFLTPVPTFNLTEPAPLVISHTTSVSADGAYEINCADGKGSINIAVTGGSTGNYTYAWSTADGAGIVPGQKDQMLLKAGTYHLVVTDLNGCTATKDITLRDPPDFSLQLVPSHITCQTAGFNNGAVDLSVTGGIAPYSYAWSNGSAQQDISGLTEGYYRVKVTYNNTCSLKDSVRVNLPPPLTYNKTLSNYNSFNVSCYGRTDGSITVNPLTGQAPYIYSWTGPNGFTASSKDISSLRAGNYQLTITDSNFCAASELINISEPGLLGMTFNLSSSNSGGFNINCAGDSTGTIVVEPFNNVSDVQYIWSDGVSGKARQDLPAGSYGIIITDANNCQSGAVVNLTQPDSIKLNFSISKPFCPDMPDGEIRLNVSGGVRGTDYVYEWSGNQSGNTISNILRGFYKVTVEDLNGCSAKDSVVIEPQNETCLVIRNVISPNGDLINDVWNIGMIELYPKVEVKIFNRYGQTIWKSERGYPVPWDGKSSGAELPIDSYHYIIDLNNGTKPVIGNVTIVR